MSKNNQKTIADLNINWTFDWNIDSGVLATIQELNPEIHSLKIVKNIYRFFIDDWDFTIETLDDEKLSDLIYRIDWKIFSFQTSKKLPKVLVLNRFELVLDMFGLIKENTFHIHVKK